MPAGSSVGWLGCSRTESRPGSPSVPRKRVTTRRFLATSIRSALRQILLTAAAISGVSPGASAARTSPSRFVRQEVVAQAAHGEVGDGGEGGGVVRVEDQAGDLVGLVGHHGLVEERAQRQVGERQARGHPLRLRVAAATPASTSPERAGEARASRVRRSGNTWRVPPSVAACMAGAPHRVGWSVGRGGRGSKSLLFLKKKKQKDFVP